MVPDWPGVGSINPDEPGPSLSGQGQSQDASGSMFLFWAHPRAGPFSNIAPPRVGGGGVGGSTPACGKEVATWLLVLVRTKEDKRVRQPSSREKSVPPTSESLLQGTCPRTQGRCVLTPTVYFIQALPPPKDSRLSSPSLLVPSTRRNFIILISLTYHRWSEKKCQ